MAKYRVAELEGALLDLAVAKALGVKAVIENGMCQVLAYADSASEHYQAMSWNRWSEFGPIIERERIETMPANDAHGWGARITDADGWSEGWRFGPTPLIAAMRAFVASKLGEEVEL